MDVLRTPHLLFLLSYVEVLQSRVAQSPLWPFFCRESMYLRDSSHREYAGEGDFREHHAQTNPTNEHSAVLNVVRTGHYGPPHDTFAPNPKS